MTLDGAQTGGERREREAENDREPDQAHAAGSLAERHDAHQQPRGTSRPAGAGHPLRRRLVRPSPPVIRPARGLAHFFRLLFVRGERPMRRIGSQPQRRRPHAAVTRHRGGGLEAVDARALVLDGEVAIYDQQLRSRCPWLRGAGSARAFFTGPPV